MEVQELNIEQEKEEIYLEQEEELHPEPEQELHHGQNKEKELHLEQQGMKEPKQY